MQGGAAHFPVTATFVARIVRVRKQQQRIYNGTVSPPASQSLVHPRNRSRSGPAHSLQRASARTVGNFLQASECGQDRELPIAALVARRSQAAFTLGPPTTTVTYVGCRYTVRRLASHHHHPVYTHRGGVSATERTDLVLVSQKLQRRRLKCTFVRLDLRGSWGAKHNLVRLGRQLHRPGASTQSDTVQDTAR